DATVWANAYGGPRRSAYRTGALGRRSASTGRPDAIQLQSGGVPKPFEVFRPAAGSAFDSRSGTGGIPSPGADPSEYLYRRTHDADTDNGNPAGSASVLRRTIGRDGRVYR